MTKSKLIVNSKLSKFFPPYILISHTRTDLYSCSSTSTGLGQPIFFIIHPCDPTVVICYLIRKCDIAVCITYLISYNYSLTYNLKIFQFGCVINTKLPSCDDIIRRTSLAFPLWESR